MEQVYYELANRRVLGRPKAKRWQISGDVSRLAEEGQALSAGNNASEHMEAVCIEKYHKLVQNEYVAALMKAVIHDAQTETQAVMKSLNKVKEFEGFKTARHDVAGYLGYLYYSKGEYFGDTWWLEMQERIYQLICVCAFLEVNADEPTPSLASIHLFNKITRFRSSDNIQTTLSENIALASDGYPKFLLCRQRRWSWLKWFVWFITILLVFVPLLVMTLRHLFSIQK